MRQRQSISTRALLFVLLFPVLASAFSDEIIVLPEITTPIELSSTDVNPIRCPGHITSIVTSEEKNVRVDWHGDTGLVKFLAIQTGEEITYSSTPTELIVSCDEEFYKMIAQPTPKPSVTVRLGTGNRDVAERNREHFAGMPWEDKLLTLIREAYDGAVPETYRALPPAEDPIPFSSAVSLRMQAAYHVLGEALALYVFSLTAREDTIEVSERELLRATLPIEGKKAAIAVIDHTLSPGQTTRAFVVTRDAALPTPGADALIGSFLK